MYWGGGQICKIDINTLTHRPAHLPTGRFDCQTLQVKGHRRKMSFLNKLWPTSTGTFLGCALYRVQVHSILGVCVI